MHGFISMLLNILEGEKPTHLCVAFDVSRESFRTEELPEYKGTRGETPEEFIGQTELLVEALTAMRITSVSRERFEADDLIASLAHLGEKAGMRVLVVSGDRDTFQLITEQTTILYPVKGVMNLARMDDAAVLEKYGVHAKQYPELAALVGETSDNLKGIPGVGPKTAAKWIQQFGSLDAILESAEEIPGKVGESLRENKELAVRNRRLNELVRSLEFDFGMQDLALGSVDEDQVKEVFAKLSFRTLLTRVLKLRGVNGTQHPVLSARVEDDSPEHEPMREAPRGPDLPTEPPKPEISSISDIEKLVAEGAFLKLELAEGSLVGLGAATTTKRLDWNGKDVEGALKLVATGGFGSWDAKNSYRRFAEAGIVLGELNNDALLAAYLIDPSSKDLDPDALVRRYAGVDVVRADADQLLSEPEPSLDAWCYAMIWAALAPRLEDEESLPVYKDIELPVAGVLN